MKTEAYLKSWLALRSGCLKVRTVECYASLIRLHIAPQIGDIDVDQLTAPEIVAMLAMIVASGHTRTAELCFVLLKAALKECAGTPMRGVPRPAHLQVTPDAWTDDQIIAYMAALQGHRHGLALQLGLVLGLRRGEIVGLRWSDIDFDRGVVNVCNQRLRLDSGKIIDATPKSRSSVRSLPLPAALLVQLRRRRQLTGYVCPLTPSGLDAAHRRLVQRLGLPYIPLHGLRHSMATAVIRHGGDMRCLQLLLGHASYATTANRYTHPDRAMLQSSLDAAARVCYTGFASKTGVCVPDS